MSEMPSTAGRTRMTSPGDDNETFDQATKTHKGPFFHGMNLQTQPILTKRGRKTGKLVSRIFVILEGYLFYFQHPAATTIPCGVLALQKAEYFVHSYASSALRGNFCLEVRSPLRAWGTLILHYHGYTPTAIQKVKQILNVAGAYRRRNPFDTTISEATPGINKELRPSQLNTLSSLANLLPQWVRRKRDDLDDHDEGNAMTIVDGVTEVKVTMDSNTTNNNNAENDDTIVCKVTRGARTSLLKIKRRNSGSNRSTERSSMSPQSGHLCPDILTLKDHDEINVEHEISLEYCHEVCVNGFVENARRSFFPFIWPWDNLQLLRPSRSDATLRFSVVVQGAMKTMQSPRIRCSSASVSSKQFYPTDMATRNQWTSSQQHQRLAIDDGPEAQPLGTFEDTTATTTTSVRRNSGAFAKLQMVRIGSQNNEMQVPAPEHFLSKDTGQLSMPEIASNRSPNRPQLPTPLPSVTRRSSPTSFQSKARDPAERRSPAASLPVAPDLRLVQAVSLAESYSGGYLLRQYKPLKVIGRGGFGYVMVARHLPSGSLVAIKTLSKRAIAAQNQIPHSRAEKTVLTHCRGHPFIVTMHACFQTIDHLHLVLDYCPGGELFFHLAHRGHFSESIAAFYVAEVLVALEHLHEQDIIYRDLKPENILLDEQGHVRLADFGLSKPGIDDWTLAMTFCGSKDYIAPEVLALGETRPARTATPSRGYGKAVDFWALGCMLFEMLTGQPPFYHATNRTQLYSMIMDGTIHFPSTISPEARDLMENLLRTDPRQRLGARRGFGGGATAIKQHRFFAKHDIDWLKLLTRTMCDPPLRPRSGAFANFDSEFTSMALRDIDNMVKFPDKIPLDYQLFDDYNWEPAAK